MTKICCKDNSFFQNGKMVSDIFLFVSEVGYRPIPTTIFTRTLTSKRARCTDDYCYEA